QSPDQPIQVGTIPLVIGCGVGGQEPLGGAVACACAHLVPEAAEALGRVRTQLEVAAVDAIGRRHRLRRFPDKGAHWLKGATIPGQAPRQHRRFQPAQQVRLLSAQAVDLRGREYLYYPAARNRSFDPWLTASADQLPHLQLLGVRSRSDFDSPRPTVRV